MGAIQNALSGLANTALAGSVAATHVSQQKKLIENEEKQEMAEIPSKIAKINSELAEGKAVKAEQKLEKATEKADKAQARVEQTGGRVSELQKQYDELKGKENPSTMDQLTMRNLESELSVQRDILKEQSADLVKAGEKEQKSLSQALRKRKQANRTASRLTKEQIELNETMKKSYAARFAELQGKYNNRGGTK